MNIPTLPTVQLPVVQQQPAFRGNDQDKKQNPEKSDDSKLSKEDKTRLATLVGTIAGTAAVAGATILKQVLKRKK